MNQKKIVLFSAICFFCSILFLLGKINVPNYGGDEVRFAKPLLYKSVFGLSPFEFEYAGPLKTICAAPIFSMFGFNIYYVRIFSIAVFIFGFAAWCIYLARRKYWVAISATLLAVAANHDLLFFAKTDINQFTFYNAVTACYFISFIILLEKGANWRRSILFILLTLIEINNHLRNIWIINAMLAAAVIESYINLQPVSLNLTNVKLIFKKILPVLVGWCMAVVYFIFIISYFKGSALLESAKNLHSDASWIDRLLNVFSHCAGGAVLMRVYADDFWRFLIVVFGAVICFCCAALFKSCSAPRTTDLWLQKLLRVCFWVTFFIMLQYIFSRSAHHPWHGDGIELFMAIFLGLLAQSLFVIGKKGALMVFFGFVITITGAVAVEGSLNFMHPRKPLNGFKLAVWNLQSLDGVREYILNNPGKYFIADWGISWPLALEIKYRPTKDVVIIEHERLDLKEVSGLKDCLVIRSTRTGLTVPDYSDEAIAKFDASLHFQVIKSFYDEFQREVYQVGFLNRDRHLLN
jgi:hypothetical protein